MTKIQTQESTEFSSKDLIDGSPEEFYSHSNVPAKKSSAEKKLVRKINWVLLPFITVISFITTMNKTTFSRYSLQGQLMDAPVTIREAAQINVISITIFYVSILLNVILIQKIRISRYLGVLLLIWGIVMCCGPISNSFSQRAASSAFISFCEAGILPSLLIVISSIYSRSEQPIAFGFLWAIEALTTTAYALCNFGMSKAGEKFSWNDPYYIWGGLTIAIALITFVFFPDVPDSFAFRLSEEEKEIVEERVKNSTAVRVNEFKSSHILEALKEPRFYFISIAQFLNSFHTIIISLFTAFYLTFTFKLFEHYSVFRALPQAICIGIYSILVVFIARKSGQLYLGLLVSSTIALIGLILMAALPDNESKLVGLFFTYATNGTGLMLYIMIGVNVTGYSKKLFYNSMGYIFACLGNTLSPYLIDNLIDNDEGPGYKTAMIVTCIGQGIIPIMLFFNRQLMSKQNKIKLSISNNELYDARNDLTDRQNKKFIYKL